MYTRALYRRARDPHASTPPRVIYYSVPSRSEVPCRYAAKNFSPPRRFFFTFALDEPRLGPVTWAWQWPADPKSSFFQRFRPESASASGPDAFRTCHGGQQMPKIRTWFPGSAQHATGPNSPATRLRNQVMNASLRGFHACIAKWSRLPANQKLPDATTSASGRKKD